MAFELVAAPGAPAPEFTVGPDMQIGAAEMQIWSGRPSDWPFIELFSLTY
jgi:hypothetical protein